MGRKFLLASAIAAAMAFFGIAGPFSAVANAGGQPPPAGLPGASQDDKAGHADPAPAEYYVKYTLYRKGPNGIVDKVSSGRSGPYYSRREAQSRVDYLHGNSYRSGQYWYYYSAGVYGG
jgi:hypothetical protein